MLRRNLGRPPRTTPKKFPKIILTIVPYLSHKCPMLDPCPRCGKDRALVGMVHNCTPPTISKVSPSVAAVGAKSSKSGFAGVVTSGTNASSAVGRGRPRIGAKGQTLTARKPWEAEGMSRTTWYRRQLEKRKADGE